MRFYTATWRKLSPPFTFTIDTAYDTFEPNVRGSLESGNPPNPVVLSRDIMRIEPITIL